MFRKTESFATYHKNGYHGIMDLYVYPGIGQMKFEFYEHMLFFHPIIYKVSKSAVQDFLWEMFATGLDILDKWGYKEVYFYTNNEKLVRFIMKNNYKLVKEDLEGKNLYCSSKEDLYKIWHKLNRG